ncbi:MAG: hypothetical protein HRU10_14885 [Opitutales bacterium]|nr:hypothetical protein [Opitutales bacterium]
MSTVAFAQAQQASAPAPEVTEQPASEAPIEVPTFGLNTPIDNEDPAEIEDPETTLNETAPATRTMTVEEAEAALRAERKIKRRHALLAESSPAADAAFFTKLRRTIVTQEGEQRRFHRRLEYLELLIEVYRRAKKAEDTPSMELVIGEVAELKPWIERILQAEKGQRRKVLLTVNLIKLFRAKDPTIAAGLVRYVIDSETKHPALRRIKKLAQRKAVLTAEPVTPLAAIERL